MQPTIPSFTKFEKDSRTVENVTVVFLYPIFATTEVLTGGPLLPVVASLAASYYLFDGSATSLIYSYLAGGAVYALLARSWVEKAVAYEATKAKQYGEYSWCQANKNTFLGKMMC